MRKLRTVLRGFLYGLVALVAVTAALFGYYAYTPAPRPPQLSGTLAKGAIEVAGVRRSYLTYVPAGIAKGAPLVVALHGSGGNGAELRRETGYAFDRLADEQGFVVVYPHARNGYWDACSIVGAVQADGPGSDDVGFLTAMVDMLVTDLGVDPARVFAVGSSRGGSMALRLAIEAPSRFRATAAVSASVPTPENFKCKTSDRGSSSVMFMNGTRDPIVPFNGGEVSLFGLLYRNGRMLSARDSGQYFAQLNQIRTTARTSEWEVADGIRVESMQWRDHSKVEVELIAIHGGGHGIPQRFQRRPRILGPSAMEPDGPALIWDFFQRQRP